MRWRLSSGLLILALAAQIYFLMHDLSWFPGSGHAPLARGAPMAELVSRVRDVRIQDEGDLVWETARAGQTLYRRQSVLTLDRSKAEVAFLDGTGIIVDENSLIQIEKIPSADDRGYRKIVIRLLRGALHKREPRRTSALLKTATTQPTPELQIEIGNAQAVIPAEAEFSATTAASEGRIQVHAGELRVQSAGGEIELRRDEEALVASPQSQAAPVSRKPTFSAISPRGGETVRIDEKTGDALRFRWNMDPRVTAGRPLDLEVSTDPSFRDNVKRSRIAPTEPPLASIETVLKIGPNYGTEPRAWYWRVKTTDGEAVGATEKFWLAPLPVPVLRLPMNSARASAGSETEFLWNGVEGALGYELEIRTGENPSRTLTPREAYARATLTEEGAASWRVRARLSDGTYSAWSATRSLDVRTQSAPVEEELPPPPAELHDAEIQTEPAPRHTWLDRLIDSLFSSAYAAEEPVKYPVKFRWAPVKGVAKYKIQVARTRRFEKILGEAETKTAEWTWNYEVGTENSKGRVFYRVASMTSSGKVGAFSKPKAVPIPETILAHARKDAGLPEKPVAKNARPPKPEIYSATEGPVDAGAPLPADAEETGNLHTIAKVTPTPAPSPTPTPTPVVVSKAESESLGSIAPPDEPAPVAMSAAPSATDTKSQAQIPTESHWTLEAALFTGAGAQKQTGTDPSLSSVETSSAHLQQKVRIETELFRVSEDELERVRWTGVLQLGFAGYKKPGTTRTTLQPDVKTLCFDLEGIHWVQSADKHAWRVAWGGVLEKSYLWEKTGPQSVDSKSSLSLGPSLRIVRRWNGGRLIETGIRMAFPFTGALTRAHFGLGGSIWGEWNLASFDRSSLGLITEMDARYQRWTSPITTGRFSWMGSLALSVHFDLTPRSSR